MRAKADVFNYQFGEWDVEPLLNRLVRDGNKVHLEPKTLELLTYLLDRPGQTVSINELLEDVWSGRIVEPSAVHRHVARIRRSLGDDSRDPSYIETIPKRGYRAIAPVKKVAFRSGLPSQSSSRRRDNSIAVLPFANLSPDLDNAYFAVGIHEEIINQLVNIRDLSVIARTSVMQYAGVHKPIVEIANDLNVSTVMEGSIRYAGNRVRITAQLIDGGSGTNLWSEAYEEDIEDIFGIQLDIATRIAGTLEAELSPTEQERIARHATDSPEAYTHYLRALNSWGSFAPTSAIHKELEAAVKLDPNFAAALAFDAALYALEGCSRIAGPTMNAEAVRHSTALAEEYARRALEVNESEARAHFALAGVDLFYWRWESWRRGIARAYALNPHDYLVVANVGTIRMYRGDIDAGIKLVQRSIELNPADVANVWNFSHTLYQFQQWDAAERQARLTISVAPQSAFGYALLAKVLSRMDDEAGARQNAALAEARNPDIYALADVAFAYGQLGDSVAAKRIFDLAGAGDESKFADLQLHFWMHMAIGQHDAALRYLERAIKENFPAAAAMDLHQWSEHPDYNPIRSHPTFRELVQRVSMPRESSGSI